MGRIWLFITLMSFIVNPCLALELEFEPPFKYEAFSKEQAEIVLYGRVLNTSDEKVSVRIIREIISLPEDWRVATCYKICFRPNRESLDTLEIEMEANSEDSIAYHFMMSDPAIGLGSLKIYAMNVDQPSGKKEVIITGTNDVNASLTFPESQRWNIPQIQNGIFKFKLDNAHKVRVGFFDNAGRLIEDIYQNDLMGSGQFINLDISHFKPGIYYWYLTVGDASSMGPVLVK